MNELTKEQRRYLSNFVCAWCEQRLDKDDCSAIYEQCTPETRAKRRADCLESYRPRRKPAVEI